MTVSPPLNPIMMLLEGNGSLAGRDRAGAFTATGSGALRYSPAPGARVNWAFNPVLANNSLFWGGSGGTGVVNSRSTSETYNGYASFRTQVDNPNGHRIVMQSGPTIPVVAGELLSFSVAVKLPAGLTFRPLLTQNSQNFGGFITDAPGSAFVATGDWQVITHSVTANAAAVVAYAQIQYMSGWVSGTTDWYATALQFTRGSATPGALVLGGMNGAVWLDPLTGQLGTAHASPSVSRAVFWVEEGTTNLVTNPWRATNNTGWAALNGSTARSTVYAFQGPGAGLLTASAANAEEYISITAAASSHTAQAIVRNAASGSRQCQLTYNGSLIGSPVSVAAGAMQTITAPFTGTGGTANLGVRWIDSVNTNTFVTYYLGAEAKTYATSPCPAIDAAGSLGTGYSWAGIAHASASSRAVGYATVGVTADNRIDTVRGTMAARFALDYNSQQNQIILHHGTFTNNNDSVGVEKHQTSSVIRGLIRRGGNNIPATAGAIPSADVSTIAVLDWDVSVLGAALNGGTRTQVAAVGATGIPDTAFLYLGVYGAASIASLDGFLGPVVIYDQPLSSARRALVNAAIDSNGAIDLWTLFEEWEAMGLPMESSALQSGQATAGVAALALPMDTSTRQSAQATAGVRAVAQPMETGEFQEVSAVALDLSRGVFHARPRAAVFQASPKVVT